MGRIDRNILNCPVGYQIGLAWRHEPAGIHHPISNRPQDRRKSCSKRPHFPRGPRHQHTGAPAPGYYGTADEDRPICMLPSAPRSEEGAILLPSAPHRATVAHCPIDFNWLEVQLLSQSRHKDEHSDGASSVTQAHLYKSRGPKTR
ncbi:hypothetical protein EYF80_026215 [Liparis tanakae]|uniref:Uncharacterized protein n=1 Tax=Liparis tanakae TaxID=230148 RepID=A0A4Z2HF00_9TELE|nr:hypothetical protein EYF80_026215 [Liparis tanakae]